MKQPPKKYDITQCALYKCNSKRRLEQLLCLEVGELKLVKRILKYHSFEIDKKHSNEKRKITAPDYTLKLIQARILALLQKVIRPDWLISSEKGKCYIDNGKAHIDGRYLLSVDIRKFYDNCTREHVYQFFIQKLKTAPDIAKILTDIVTHNTRVPTGCPTSQIVAFYAYYDMFAEVYEIAKGFGCCFTLYVDDMTFSSKEPFLQQLLIREIDCILRKYGHKPKYSKVKYYSSTDCKPVTGTIITPQQNLVVPNSLQRTVYNGFQAIKGATQRLECNENEAQRLLSLRGQIQAARNIERDKFPEVLRIINEIKVPINTNSTQKKRGRVKSRKKIIIKA